MNHVRSIVIVSLLASSSYAQSAVDPTTPSVEQSAPQAQPAEPQPAVPVAPAPPANQPGATAPTASEPMPVYAAPVPDPTAYYHDGFYLRLALGGGYVSDSAKADSGETFKIRGGAVAFEILLGGSLVPGVVLGGGIWATPMVNPKVDFAGQTMAISSDYSVQFSQLGPFVDIYPNPAQGLHFLGAVTYSGLTLSERATNTTLANVKGFGFTGGIGYEFWVGKQWGLGILGKLSYAYLSADSETHNLVSPAILGTATFN